MKIWVQIEPDFDNEITDVSIAIEEDDTTIYCWVKGFDDVDSKQAHDYADLLAKTLGCEVQEL